MDHMEQPSFHHRTFVTTTWGHNNIIGLYNPNSLFSYIKHVKSVLQVSISNSKYLSFYSPTDLTVIVCMYDPLIHSGVQPPITTSYITSQSPYTMTISTLSSIYQVRRGSLATSLVITHPLSKSDEEIILTIHYPVQFSPC
jgi:hypothetical protein